MGNGVPKNGKTDTQHLHSARVLGFRQPAIDHPRPHAHRYLAPKSLKRSEPMISPTVGLPMAPLLPRLYERCLPQTSVPCG